MHQSSIRNIHATFICYSTGFFFPSGLTLTKCVHGVVSLSHVNDVTMFGLGGDVEQQGGWVAVSVLCPERFGADGEPQVTCDQDLQCGSTFIHHDLGDAIVNCYNGDFHGLRAPRLKHSVRENIKVSVCAISDSKGEGVLCRFSSVVFVADEVFIEVLFGEAGYGRGPVVEEFTMNRQLRDSEFQQLLSCVLVLSSELKWCDQLNLPFCDN